MAACSILQERASLKVKANPVRIRADGVLSLKKAAPSGKKEQPSWLNLPWGILYQLSKHVLVLD